MFHIFNLFRNMKKTIFAAVAAVAVLFSSCIPGVNNTTNNSGYGYGNNGGLLSGILGSVLGNMLGLGFNASDLQGNWSYNAPSAAFTTEQTMARAGGATAVNTITSSLASDYKAIGITKKNTSFNFGANNQFNAQVNGIPFSGNYSYNEKTGEITLKTGSQTLKGNLTKTANGIGLMFDANQMTALLKNVGHVSNSAAVEAVSKLAKSTNGARVGFELTK